MLTILYTAFFGVALFISIYGIVKLRQKYFNLNQEQEDKKEIVNPFDGFIGNHQAITILQRMVDYAKMKNVAPPNVALFGARSTGKTDLAKRIARAVRKPLIPLSASQVLSVKWLSERLATASKIKNGDHFILPSCVIFIDEVHSLNRKLQDNLLTALEADDKIWTIGVDQFDCKNVTFIIATTDPWRLTEAFRSRFTAIELSEYSADEVVEIMFEKVKSGAIDTEAWKISPKCFYAMAQASRLTPRIAIAHLRNVANAIAVGAIVNNETVIIKDLQELTGTDDFGLTKKDYLYLDEISTGARGSLALSATLGINQKHLEEMVEPYLIKMGLVCFTSKGRIITKKGLQLISRKRASLSSSSKQAW